MALLASRLGSELYRVTLVTLDDGANDRHRVDSSVQRVFLNTLATPTSIAPWRKLSRVRHRQTTLRDCLVSLAPDVVLSFCDRMNVDVLACLKSKPLNQHVPVVVCERSDPSQQRLGWYWERKRRQLYPFADAVVALTEASAGFLRDFSNRVEVVPSAIERPPVTSDRNLASTANLVVAAGRLEREKRFDRLIRGFHSAFATEPQWRLVIYGEGSLRPRLLDLASSLGIADRVELPGWTSPLATPLAAATVFCLSSEYEGFPSVLLEAMSMGVPSVSVDCESGPREVIEHGVNGLLVEPSEKGVVEGLQRMAEDVEQRERMGVAGRAVIDTFGTDRMIASYDALLQNILGDR